MNDGTSKRLLNLDLDIRNACANRVLKRRSFSLYLKETILRSPMPKWIRSEESPGKSKSTWRNTTACNETCCPNLYKDLPLSTIRIVM